MDNCLLEMIKKSRGSFTKRRINHKYPLLLLSNFFVSQANITYYHLSELLVDQCFLRGEELGNGWDIFLVHVLRPRDLGRARGLEKVDVPWV